MPLTVSTSIGRFGAIAIASFDSYSIGNHHGDCVQSYTISALTNPHNILHVDSQIKNHKSRIKHIEVTFANCTIYKRLNSSSRDSSAYIQRIQQEHPVAALGG